MVKPTSREFVAFFYPSHTMHSPASVIAEAAGTKGWLCDFECSCGTRLILTQRMVESSGFTVRFAREAIRHIPRRRAA